MSFVAQYLAEASQVAARIDHEAVTRLVDLLAEARAGGGRLFVLGVGGSAGNASHAVNDFRKIAGFEAYAPTDNVSELTARINDDGWETSFANWLKASRLTSRDCLLVFSVGGGDVAAQRGSDRRERVHGRSLPRVRRPRAGNPPAARREAVGSARRRH